MVKKLRINEGREQTFICYFNDKNGKYVDFHRMSQKTIKGALRAIGRALFTDVQSGMKNWAVKDYAKSGVSYIQLEDNDGNVVYNEPVLDFIRQYGDSYCYQLWQETAVNESIRRNRRR
jgi:hypothetical protein